MKRWTVYALTFICVLTILAIILKLYSNWGRSYVPSGSEITVENPGLGQKFSSYPDMFSLVDKDNIERLILAEELSNYDSKEYITTFIPSQSSLDYSVGYFQGWEDIANSEDKYILVNDAGDEINKYRIVFGLSPDAIDKRWTRSSMVVENIGFRAPKSGYTVDVTILSKIGFEKFSELLKKGDSLIVTPQRIDRDRDVVDEKGIYIVDLLTLRRSFGIYDFELELAL